MVLNNRDLNGGPNGTSIGSLSIFGTALDPLFTPQRYGIFASVVLVLTCQHPREALPDKDL
jgi:hypothetical protein